MKTEFVKAASIRAIKTIAQTILSMLTLGMSFYDVDWKMVLSVSIIAGIYSILTSIVSGLPEVKYDGELSLELNEDDVPYVKLKLDDLKDGMRVLVKDNTKDSAEP